MKKEKKQEGEKRKRKELWCANIQVAVFVKYLDAAEEKVGAALLAQPQERVVLHHVRVRQHTQFACREPRIRKSHFIHKPSECIVCMCA